MSGRKRWTHLDQVVGEGRIEMREGCESVQLFKQEQAEIGAAKTRCENRKSQNQQ
jgi:hypothetical protein